MDSSEKQSRFHKTFDDLVVEFSMESSNRKIGMILVEKAKRKAALSSNSCWQKAYQNLFAASSEILAGEEQRSRLAWHLSDCFQKDTSRPQFPYCDVKYPMAPIVKNKVALTSTKSSQPLEVRVELTSPPLACKDLIGEEGRHSRFRRL
ncbi:hypothetical protein E3N88_09563 [Mikania micrantha]|uniref:Uncharacterized protein n=1 Tax=Mikania micrantha TaxID=192012 RepID=A0A5N6PKA4_9ASTR|nr:hypothetical protein E3N88_09563 [Mikania micrantha]